MLRVDLLRALAMLIDPDAVSLNARCVGYVQDTDGIAAHLADGTEWRGNLLIGANGLHSLVREQLFGKQRPRYAGYTCWRGLAEFEDEALPSGLGFEAWGRGARFAVQHCGPGRVYWYATRNAPEDSPDGPNGRMQYVLDTLSGWHEPIWAVIAATGETGLSSRMTSQTASQSGTGVGAG